MVNITGWKGRIKPRGARYARYIDRRRKRGIQFRDTNTGAIYTPSGKFLGYEKNYKHISGSDKPHELGIGLIKKKRR